MAVQLSDIQDARELLKGIIIPTPILSDEKLSIEIGAQAYLKAECLQRSGSFKVRGAYNKISRLSDDEKKRGVIAASAGNHAQGVALAARLHGIKAVIVLPEIAPLTKVTATKAQGAEVVLHGMTFDEAVGYSRKLQQERGLTYVHAFEDETVIAGQGTIGCEIAEDLPAATVITVPIGGGGIISGIAIAAKALLPEVRIVGVQAANFAAVNPSLAAGKPVEVPHHPTIADGIAVKRPGGLTLKLIGEWVDNVVVVAEDDIAEAMVMLMEKAKLVVEGAGAVGVAALLSGATDAAEDGSTVVVLSGGNVDAGLLAVVARRHETLEGRRIVVLTRVPDRPGALAGLLDCVAEAGANIVEVSHLREGVDLHVRETAVQLIMETRGKEHAAQVLDAIARGGYVAGIIRG
jgi:threonine dehydratase